MYTVVDTAVTTWHIEGAQIADAVSALPDTIELQVKPGWTGL